VAVYARSAADDDVGTACVRQVLAARKMVGAGPEVKVYMDARCSGMDGDRAGLRRLLEDACRGGFDRVLVRDLSRLSRDHRFLDAILDELRAAGVNVEYVPETEGDDVETESQ